MEKAVERIAIAMDIVSVSALILLPIAFKSE
jgi:hypothetical protein